MLHTAQRRTGGWNWPDDVIAFFATCDGAERSPEGYVLPRHRPLSLTDVITNWEMLMSISYDRMPRSFPDEDSRSLFFAQLANESTPGVVDGSLEPNYAKAGTLAGRFISSWLPVAEDQNGSFLVVDRRVGPKFGCLIELDKVDADLAGTVWPGLGLVLGAVNDALTNGTSLFGGRDLPSVVGGRITWSRLQD